MKLIFYPSKVPFVCRSCGWNGLRKGDCDGPGLPAITLPVAMSEEGLPLGLQLVGPRFGDASVLAIAQVLERCAARGETASDGLLPVKAASEGSAAKET